MSGKQPWHDGIWVNDNMASHIAVITGTETQHKGLVHLDYPDIKADFFGTLESGDFGETPDDIRSASGSVRFNLKMKNNFFESNCVLSGDGKQIYMKSFMVDRVDVMELADEAKLDQLREDREPFDAPALPSYITPQPNKQGKLLWFSGPPGSGKSTSAQLMARHHGYIYYEGDGLLGFLNPYVDINVDNPSMATFTQQKPLKGIPAETIKIMSDLSDTFQNMMQGSFDDTDEAFISMIPPLSDHVTTQRQRLGGDMAVAFAFFSRAQREAVRKHLGDVVFLVLNMTRECQKKRIDARHANMGVNMDFLYKMYDLYEPAGDDEENTFNLTITENMTPDDVIKEAQKIVEKL